MTGSYEKRVLLTGATGFMGAHLLDRLLAEGARVHCIARPRRETSATERVLKSLELVRASAGRGARAGQGAGPGTLRVHAGDLCELDAAATARAVRSELEVDEIWHCAASTDLARTAPEELERGNVESTRRVLALADALGVGRLHVLGTAYQCGLLPERIPEERLVRRPPAFRNAYEWSKWRAEELLWSWRHAAERLTVYRPSIVIGRTSSELVTHWQGFYLYIRQLGKLLRLAESGAAERIRIPGRADTRLNLVFVDGVIDAMRLLGADERTRGGVFHLVSESSWTVGQLARAVQCTMGVGALDVSDEAAVVERWSSDRVIATLTPYLLSTPRFDTTQRDAILRDHGFELPRMTEALGRRHIALGLGRRLEPLQRARGIVA